MLQLSSKRKTLDVQIDEETYQIREMLGGNFTEYLKAQSKRVKVDSAGKQVGVADVTDLFSDLICRCLFKLVGNAYALVTKDQVNEWPKDLVTELFKQCQTLNGIQQDEEAKDPKDQDINPA